jgi:hypothetical protein
MGLFFLVGTDRVHLVMRPLLAYLTRPRWQIMVIVGQLVEWRLAGENKGLGENLPQCHFIHHKSHMTRSGLEPWSPRWESSNYFFFNLNTGGWSPYWVHSALRPHLAYYTCPGWLWWRSWWNEWFWQGKRKYSEKTCPDAILSTTNPTWPDPGANPGRRGGKPATNRFGYGAAYVWAYFTVCGIVYRGLHVSSEVLTQSCWGDWFSLHAIGWHLLLSYLYNISGDESDSTLDLLNTTWAWVRYIRTAVHCN